MEKNKNWTSAKIFSEEDRSTIITNTGGLGYERDLMTAMQEKK